VKTQASGYSKEALNRMTRSLIFVRSKDFSFLQNSTSACSGHMRVVKWYRGSLFAGEAVRLESEHSCPCTAQFKNNWSYTSNPLFVFVGYTETNLTFVTEGSAVVLGPGGMKGRLQQISSKGSQVKTQLVRVLWIFTLFKVTR
jgi:hypothetical protein